MRTIYRIAAIAASFLIASPALAATVFNSAPSTGFKYGNGNDYTPANAAVSTTPKEAFGTEIALRMHETGVAAPASDASGVYSFALGTAPISFDWYLRPLSEKGDFASALITVMNLGTGLTKSYNPFFPGNDNTFVDGSYQNSAKLSFGFLLGSGFTPNTDSSYSVNFTSGANSLTTYAKLGAGAPGVALPGAVPEPATWAMMLVGFGAVGFSMRRQRSTKLAMAA